MKEKIREFVKSLEIDDVGFTSVIDYNSPKSPKLEVFFPEAKSIIVLAYKDLSSCETTNMQLAMNGRYDKNAAMHINCYKISHFLENQFHAKAISIPTTFTIDLNGNSQRGVSDFSLRHAAIASGLGSLGRHNLVIHPKFGTRVNFNAIITNLELESDERISEDYCAHCNICVNNCPARALDEEGKTDVLKCMKVSKPFGINSFLQYVDKFTNANQEDKIQMLSSFNFLPFYQAISGERDYNCFNCLKLCPVGQKL